MVWGRFKRTEKNSQEKRKVYRRYRLDSCWTAFDMERKKYRKMLVEAKNACYSHQVKECKGDTKGLYRMVNTLMGTSSSNPLPSHTYNSDLAEEFADFFMGKIDYKRTKHTDLQESSHLV